MHVFPVAVCFRLFLQASFLKLLIFWEVEANMEELTRRSTEKGWKYNYVLDNFPCPRSVVTEGTDRSTA